MELTELKVVLCLTKIYQKQNLVYGLIVDKYVHFPINQPFTCYRSGNV